MYGLSKAGFLTPRLVFLSSLQRKPAQLPFKTVERFYICVNEYQTIVFSDGLTHMRQCVASVVA